MSGEQPNWYLSGDTLKPTIITLGGVDTTYSTLATWYTIRNLAGTLLQYDYTAPTDLLLLLALQFQATTNTNDRHIDMGIWDSDLVCHSHGIMWFGTANRIQSNFIMGAKVMAADDTLTFMGRVYLAAGSAQTITMASDPIKTKLFLIPIIV